MDKVDEDSVLIKIKPITFEHDSTYYVPVFQRNFKEDGTPLHSPTFEYSMEMACTDEQLACSCDPDYILVLKGHFKATTKPFTV